jgi:hypothetical protein
MVGIARNIRRAAFLAGLGIAAVVAIAAPSKPAAADEDWGHYGHRHGWHQSGYRGDVVFAYQAPRYYAPAPAYYYPPPVYYAPAPVYYPPAPVYAPAGLSLNFVIPLQFR